jgi:CrcB protein
MLGSFAFGAIVGLAQHRASLSDDARAFLLVGVLGGFTTFSTFAFDGLTLREGQSGLALGYLLGQVVLGVTAAWLGLRLAQ